MSEASARSAISDRLEIIDILYRYCRAVDRMDRDLGYSIWHDDAVVDYGADVYRGTGRGVIDFVCEAHKGTLAHTHRVTNIVLDLADDSAVSEAYVMATLRVMRDGRLYQIVSHGRYLDRWARRAGRWGIVRRDTIIDFDEIGEVTPIRMTSPARRDRTDPSYAVLEDKP